MDENKIIYTICKKEFISMQEGIFCSNGCDSIINEQIIECFYGSDYALDI